MLDSAAGRPHAEGMLIINYGAGLDSTGVLVGLHQRGVTPDVIIFSDTGAEQPHTYAYLDVMDAWCERVGFPKITRVKYAPVRAPYTTLEGKCLSNETLPSLAFGGHSCALVFKRDVMNKFLKKDARVLSAIARGETITKMIGYDNGDRDRKRAEKSERSLARLRAKKLSAETWEAHTCEFRYPLIEWGWDRDRLAQEIEAAGLPVPQKSSCYFCPAMKLDEIVDLKRKHLPLFERAIRIEQGARDGRNGLRGTLGLGRKFAWEWLADATTVDEAREALRAHGAKDTHQARP